MVWVNIPFEQEITKVKDWKLEFWVGSSEFSLTPSADKREAADLTNLHLDMHSSPILQEAGLL